MTEEEWKLAAEQADDIELRSLLCRRLEKLQKENDRLRTGLERIRRYEPLPASIAAQALQEAEAVWVG